MNEVVDPELRLSHQFEKDGKQLINKLRIIDRGEYLQVFITNGHFVEPKTGVRKDRTCGFRVMKAVNGSAMREWLKEHL